MRRTDEAWGHNRYAPVAEGNLQRIVGRAHETLQTETAQNVEDPYLPPRRTRRDPTAGDLTEPLDDSVRRGDYESTPLGVRRPQDLEDRRFDTRIGGLYVDVDRGTGKLLEDLLERRHSNAPATIWAGASAVGAEVAAGIEPAKLVDGYLRDDACPARGPVHGRVVDHDDVPVTGQMDVELEAAGPSLHRDPERLQGVLRGQGRGAPVGQIDGPFARDGPPSLLPQDQGDRPGQSREGDQSEVLSSHQENIA